MKRSNTARRESGRWRQRVRSGLGWTALCGVLFAGFIGMTHGQQLFAQAAGLPTGERLLANAIVTGDAATARRALATGASPNARTDGGVPALIAAAYVGDAMLVHELLAHGADPNIRGHRGWTALDSAALRGHADVIAALLAAGADPAKGRGLAQGRSVAVHKRTNPRKTEGLRES